MLNTAAWRFPLFGRYDDKQLKKDLNDKVLLRLEKLEERVAELSSANDSLEGRTEALETRIESLEARVEALEP